MPNVMEEMISLKDNYEKMVKTKGQEIVDLLVKEFLDKHPDVDGLNWAQYTPYFNDGDACVFHIGEIYLVLNDPHSPVLKEGSTSDFGDNRYDSYNIDADYDYKTKTATGPQAALAMDLRELEKTLNQFEDVLLAVFDDHVQVEVTRSGYEVDDYSHD